MISVPNETFSVYKDSRDFFNSLGVCTSEQLSILNFDQVHKAALGRRMGPFRARVEKLGPDNLHLAPTNTNQAANQVDLKLDDEEGSPPDMDQSL